MSVSLEGLGEVCRGAASAELGCSDVRRRGHLSKVGCSLRPARGELRAGAGAVQLLSPNLPHSPSVLSMCSHLALPFLSL